MIFQTKGGYYYDINIGFCLPKTLGEGSPSVTGLGEGP